MTTKYKLVPYLQPLFDYFYNEHRLTLTTSQMEDVIQACKEAMLEVSPAQESEPVAYITIPKNADEAEAMQKLGYACLKENAPERLTHPPADKAWISVKDRMPDVEVDVVVCGIRFNSWYQTVAGLFDGVFKSQETEKETLFDVTHWMPLPAPPNEAMKG